MDANPLSAPLLITFAAGLAGAALSRLSLLPRRGRAVLAALLFPIAYLAVYGKFFPLPRASTDKLFYAGLFGLILPLIPLRLSKAGTLAALLPALWIAVPRLTTAGAGRDLVLLILLGALVLLRSASLAAAARPGAGALFWALALALWGGAAPVALAGGSSTSLVLLLALVGGGAPWGLAEFLAPRPGDAALAFLWSGPLALAAILLFVGEGGDGVYLLALAVLALVITEGAKRALTRFSSPRLVVLGAGFALLLAVGGVTGALYLSAPEAFRP